MTSLQKTPIVPRIIDALCLSNIARLTLHLADYAEGVYIISDAMNC